MNHDKFYSKAFLYDIAFGFKDIASENGTLIDVYQEINGELPKSFLDIAAGPAANAMDMSKRGIESIAIENQLFLQTLQQQYLIQCIAIQIN